MRSGLTFNAHRDGHYLTKLGHKLESIVGQQIGQNPVLDDPSIHKNDRSFVKVTMMTSMARVNFVYLSV